MTLESVSPLVTAVLVTKGCGILVCIRCPISRTEYMGQRVQGVSRMDELPSWHWHYLYKTLRMRNMVPEAWERRHSLL